MAKQAQSRDRRIRRRSSSSSTHAPGSRRRTARSPSCCASRAGPSSSPSTRRKALPPERAVAEFHELGLGEPLPISAAHGENVRDLIDIALEQACARADEPRPTRRRGRTRAIKVAVVGRPNVGKSTLVNALLGEERVIAFDEPGTTRDAIYLDFERGEPALHADRHRRRAPPRQGQRSGREILGHQDAAGDRGRARRRAAASTPERASPSRTRISRATSSRPDARSWSPSTSGTRPDTEQRASVKRDVERKLAISRVRRTALHLRARRPWRRGAAAARSTRHTPPRWPSCRRRG